jgi:hypothetical protein
VGTLPPLASLPVPCYRVAKRLRGPLP